MTEECKPIKSSCECEETENNCETESSKKWDC